MQPICNPPIALVLSSELYWKVAVVFIVLCVFYNYAIDKTFEAGYERDTTVWFVCGGVILNTIGLAIVFSLNAALASASLFILTGIVMILGAFRRNGKAKQADNQELKEAIEVNRSVLSDKRLKRD